MRTRKWLFRTLTIWSRAWSCDHNTSNHYLLRQPCHRSSVLFLGTCTPLPFCFGPPFPLGFCTCQKGPCLICCWRQILFWWLSHSCPWWYGELAPEINGGFSFNTQKDATIQNEVLWYSWQVIHFSFWSQWSAGEGLGGGPGVPPCCPFPALQPPTFCFAVVLRGVFELWSGGCHCLFCLLMLLWSSIGLGQNLGKNLFTSSF